MTMTANEMILSRGLERDLPMMEAYIDATHPHIPAKHIPFAEYLMHWNEAKERGNLFKLFGGKLIVSKKITYERTYDEVCNEFDTSRVRYFYVTIYDYIVEMAKEVIDDFVTDFDDRLTLKRYFADIYNWRYAAGEEVHSAIQRNSSISDFYMIAGTMAKLIRDIDTWFNNEIDCGNTNLGSATLPGCSKKFVLPQGIKPVRAITRFMEFMTAYYKDVKPSFGWADRMERMTNELEELRQAASMMTNQKKFSGTMSISIHPFDYMTMSDPSNGWTSCMRWEDGDPGEYHAGTLEMMTSPCVVVAYLESKDHISPAGINYQWNKKNWRELFVVDPKFISGVKGYPYCNKKLENIVFEMLNDLARKNWNTSFDFSAIEEIDGDSGYHDMYLQTNFMYNDWAYNWCRVMPAVGLDFDTLPREYQYGEECFCLVCGGSRGSYNDDEHENPEVLWCESCDGAEICPICGRRTYDGLCEAPDGRMVCEYCLDDYQTCPVCGIQHHREDMVELHFTYRYESSWGWRNTDWYFYVCEDHAEEMRKTMCEPTGWNRCGYSRQVTRLNEETFELLKKCAPDFFERAETNDYEIRANWLGAGERPKEIATDQAVVDDWF